MVDVNYIKKMIKDKILKLTEDEKDEIKDEYLNTKEK